MDSKSLSDKTNVVYVEETDETLENKLNSNLEKIWLDKAELELGERETDRAIKLKQLKDLILADSELPIGRRDDAFLLRFLRAKKFDLNNSFKMIKKYFKMKGESPDLFKVSPINEMYDILSMQIQQILPLRDANGRVIFIFRIQNLDPHKCVVEKVFRSNVLVLENAICDPRTQISGLVVLLDMSGVGFAHAKFLSPYLAKRTVEVVQEAFPMRFKAFHILHEPFYFDAILAVLRPFLKDKIRKRIMTHGNDLSSLHRHIPKEILPVEYGGLQPAFNNTKWREQIIRNENYFVRLESYNYRASVTNVSRKSSDESVKVSEIIHVCNQLEIKMKESDKSGK